MPIQRVLITGANGLLGQELVRQIASQNALKLLATGKANRSFLDTPLNHSYVQLDVHDSTNIQQVFREFSPEYVINCAAMTQVDECERRREECWRTNAEAVGTLAKLCRGIGTHLIHLSTDFVFNGKSGPYREFDRPDPINYYGKSKLAGENAARSAGVNKWTIIRTNVVYGITSHSIRHDFVHWVRNSLVEEKQIHVYTDQWRTPSYTYDLVRGILQIVHFQKSGVYNLSGREFLSMYEFAQSIAQAFDLDLTLIQPTVQKLRPQEAPRPEYTGLVTLKAETELGYRPLPLNAALKHLRQRMENNSSRSSFTDAWN